jgi:hypothetical protein
MQYQVLSSREASGAAQFPTTHRAAHVPECLAYSSVAAATRRRKTASSVATGCLPERKPACIEQAEVVMGGQAGLGGAGAPCMQGVGRLRLEALFRGFV